MSATHMGYGIVPDGQRGWNGDWGTVPEQGPIERPCMNCDRSERAHSPADHFAHCRYFRAAPTRPRPEEIVAAEVITRWDCHACGEENDVSGEGAVGGWMECSRCSAHSWLEMDA